ncbi:hypothetical protein ABXS69_01630 [Actinomyces timonensis]|uniref:Uncharacterized protein n=1 Tax=Actinomyces timonensis TaxID=1288391 RepID=A0AAU8N4M1_9ACTO
MARRWQVITVELLGGRGIDLDPPPGRDLIAPPSTTFAELAHAIDLAFARWDRAHHHEFALADGTRIIDDVSQCDLATRAATGGPILDRVLPGTTAVKPLLERGGTMRYVFDLSDRWVYRCAVTDKISVERLIGPRITCPQPIRGWGDLPDQYGRTRPDAERHRGGGARPAPEAFEPRPSRRARRAAERAEARYRWDRPDREERRDPRGERGRPRHLEFLEEFGAPVAEPVDVGAVRRARARRDIPSLVSAITGADCRHALQQVGACLAGAWRSSDGPGHALREPMTAAMLSAITQLELRGWPGDDVLAELIMARLREERPAGSPLPLRLGALVTSIVAGAQRDGVWLDLDTGVVWPASILATRAGRDWTGPITPPVEGDAALGIAPGHRWLHLDESDPGTAWSDRRAFIALLGGGRTEEEIVNARALGRGAERGPEAFYAAVVDRGLDSLWLAFRDDRRWGRARAALAAEGLRPA